MAGVRSEKGAKKSATEEVAVDGENNLPEISPEDPQEGSQEENEAFWEEGEIALVGGGVIGAGWAARFVLNGRDVVLYDPSDDAAQRCQRIIEQAERAFAQLTTAPLPPRGRFRQAEHIEEALGNAVWVQESVPEREDLKQRVLGQLAMLLPDETPIASSTSGLLPSSLQARLRCPERFFVAHPFHPVYLLPLVELVGGEHTSKVLLRRAKKFYESFGMKGLIVRKEIDAFIADRLLESVWREALWLVKDGVATTEEIDDAIRYGFGLRWAQMGIFETYRVAGGDGGFRHFLAQFAPSLLLPWSRLVDVPQWSDDLQKVIVDQSDAQARGRSTIELERIRDGNLAGIINALKGENWGAGALLAEYERRLAEKALARETTAGEAKKQTQTNEEHKKETHKKAKQEENFLQQGEVCLLRERVSELWLDENGHMTESRYLQVFSQATNLLLAFVGFDDACLARGFGFYTLETNLRHLHEAKRGEGLVVATRVVDCREKKLHLVHRMFSASSKHAVIATAEHVLLHVARAQSRSVAMEQAVFKGCKRLCKQQQSEAPLDFLRLSLQRKKP